MKKLLIFSIFGVLFSLSATAQDLERYNIIRTMEDLAIFKQSYYVPARTQGAPYINKNFLPALVGGVNKNAVMRYDIYKDEFEFINGKDTLVLNKAEPFTSITFTITNTKYELLDYKSKDKEVKGYLIPLAEKNGFTVYKKQNMNFYKEKLAKTGYEQDKPAHFEKASDSFFFKNGDSGIIEFPDSKKALIKLYPDKKTQIEAFIKENKIDLEKEPDVIRMVEFLST